MNKADETLGGKDENATTSHRVTMTIHPDLYSVIKDYKDNHDCTIGFAAAQICAIGAEATEGRFVHAIVSPWGGSRDGAGRPAANDDDE